MKIFISAAEASSDAHGAEMLKALRARVAASGTPQASIDAFGIGGPKLRQAGLRTIVDSSELLSMGFVEVVGKLPRILRILRTLSIELEREKPDVAVVIDYPDFHMRVARILYRLRIPAFYYIPPKLWVWRSGRIAKLRKYFRKVFCIFPFEEEFYRRERMPVSYVGNPLLDELPFGLARAEARAELGIDAQACVATLLPGSRPAEVSQHFGVMIGAARIAAAELRKVGRLGDKEKLRVLIPLPEVISSVSLDTFASDDLVDISISRNNSATCLVAADAALVKSGTSTLEAALLRCPHAVVYKTSKATAWIFRAFVRYGGPVGLVNLILPREKNDPLIAREILLEAVTESNLADELVRLLSDAGAREAMNRKFIELREALMGGAAKRSPSARLAEEILEGSAWQTR